MNRLVRLGCLLLLAVAATMPGQALAQSCSMAVDPVIEFGTIMELPTPATTVTARIIVTCGVDERFVCVGIGAGTGIGSTEEDRRMMILAPRLNTVRYQLYKDAALTEPFGTQGDDRAGVLFAPTAPGNFAMITVYGRLLPGQIGKDIGDYLSTLLVDLESHGANRRNCNGNGLLEQVALMTAHLRIGPSCSIVVAPLDFGTHANLTGSSGATNLSVTCVASTPYSIALTGGNANNVADRRMRRTEGTDTIAYQLYRDSMHTLIWGDTPGMTVEGIGTGAAQSIPVYGFVPAQPEPQSGAYSDFVTAVVTY